MYENFVHHNQGLNLEELQKPEILHAEAEKPCAVAGDYNRVAMSKFN